MKGKENCYVTNLKPKDQNVRYVVADVESIIANRPFSNKETTLEDFIKFQTLNLTEFLKKIGILDEPSDEICVTPEDVKEIARKEVMLTYTTDEISPDEHNQKLELVTQNLMNQYKNLGTIFNILNHKNP